MKQWEIDQIKRAIQSCKNKRHSHYENQPRKMSNAIRNEDTKIKALKKQIPQEVKEFLPLNRAKCPACNGIMGAHASRKYCYYCGQALEWHEEE